MEKYYTVGFLNEEEGFGFTKDGTHFNEPWGGQYSRYLAHLCDLKFGDVIIGNIVESKKGSSLGGNWRKPGFAEKVEAREKAEKAKEQEPYDRANERSDRLEMDARELASALGVDMRGLRLWVTRFAGWALPRVVDAFIPELKVCSDNASVILDYPFDAEALAAAIEACIEKDAVNLAEVALSLDVRYMRYTSGMAFEGRWDF